jgi:hypothetical protein
VGGSNTTWAPHAKHVREATADEANRAAEASEQGGIRLRWGWAREVLDVHEVRADGSDPLDVV